jgi:DNA repair photolyase
MKRYTGHTEPWGSFVDVKTNAPEVLSGQIQKSSPGHVMISSVTDPYQPLEGQYKLTRKCLEILLSREMSVGLLTKSPLILRDLDLIEKFKEAEVGITITTEDPRIKEIFEPHAPPMEARFRTLKALYERGIKTYAFIGPILPMNPEALSEKIRPYVHWVLVDRMNYVSKTLRIYRKFALTEWLDSDFIDAVLRRLKKGFGGKEVHIC